MLYGFGNALEVAYEQVRRHSGQAVLWQKSAACLQWVIGLCVITHQLKNANWIQPGLDHILLCRWQDGLLVFCYIRSHQLSWLVHCQDVKKIPRPSGLVSWIDANRMVGLPTPPVLGASAMGHSTQRSLSVAVIPPEEGALLSAGD